MEHSSPQQGRTAWSLVVLGNAPLVLLSVYLFVFRWSERFFMTQCDYGALLACLSLGVFLIAVQRQQVRLRVVNIIFHIALSLALFGLWRLLSRPVLNDVF
jgi:hypothetical protein